MPERSIPLPPIIEALGVLQAIKDSPGTTVPTHLWQAALRAHARLESAVARAGLEVTVVEPAKEPA